MDAYALLQTYSLSAISEAYAMSLESGLVLRGWDNQKVNGMNAGTLSHLSGEVNAIKFNWEDAWKIQRSGMMANDGSGLPLTADGFNFNYQSIRQCYLVIENIDKVADISDAGKQQIKAEMLTLIAYRYQEMLKRYGGVPIVDGLLTAESDLNIPRATVRETLDHILLLCDQAIPDLPNTYSDGEKGRVTKGIPMCIKAEALMFAARPLFNSSTPYLSFGANNELISLGNEDAGLWQKAVDANLEVIDWANANGHRIINTGDPFNDYGTAVATPNNAEVLLAFKSQSAVGNYNPLTQGGGANAMSYLQLTQYYKQDGTNQAWAGEEWESYDGYVVKANEMEARFKVSAAVAGQDAWNNPGSYRWSSLNMSNASTWEGRGGTEGAGRRVKFWYMSGDQRDWFEFPLYRLAEFYLNLAEAYNEQGNTGKSHEYLNVIRDRAGLPDVTENNKDLLRQIIQREWAVEFYEENHRLFDVKHWKLNDIGNGIIGGDKKGVVFEYVDGQDGGWNPWDYVSYAVRDVYTGYWGPSQYLEPFPIAEINKGYMVQNPGY
ncbi:MAG: RagB/SusD family nutrient uptake outer membrane protein [Draconibacterium sp.]